MIADRLVGDGELEDAVEDLDRYGHLFPGSESEAADLLDAYLEKARKGAAR